MSRQKFSQTVVFGYKGTGAVERLNFFPAPVTVQDLKKIPVLPEPPNIFGIVLRVCISWQQLTGTCGATQTSGECCTDTLRILVATTIVRFWFSTLSSE
eukprot:5207068-Amphidinium_carterae.1